MADKLTAIPTPPGDAPKGVASWMTAVRSRLLAMTNQFTDAEAARLRALLNSRPATVITPAGPVFLGHQSAFFIGNAQPVWKTVAASDHGVPAGATAVIILAEYSNNNGHQSEVHVYMRVDEAGGPQYKLLRAIKDLNDPSAGGCQGIYPLRPDATFDFLMVNDFQGSGQCELYILGYFPA